MKKALVTSASGFIGTHLCRYLLEQGWQVHGLDLRPAMVPVTTHLQGDLSEVDLRQALEGVQCVFHLAGQPGVRGSWGPMFAAYAHANVVATQVLLEACVRERVQRVVFASTSSVYGASDGPMHESDRIQPVSPYGASKAAAEILCGVYAREHGLKVTILRYFSVYGPGQRPDMAFSRWIQAAESGWALPVYGDGTQLRDFTFVDDIVRGTVQAAESGQAGVYNLGRGEPISVRDAVKTLSLVLGRAVLTNCASVHALGDMRETWADIGRAELAFGYRPSVSLEEGLARQVAAYRESLEAIR